MSRIHNQVKLPIRVAFEVAMQGIKIRLGRSVVTMLGVALGIAFLMTILTGQVARRGVDQEVQLRRETQRMYNFLAAEMGPPAGHRLAAVATGALGEVEVRLLRELRRKGLAVLAVSGDLGAWPPEFAAQAGAGVPTAGADFAVVKAASPAAAAAGSHALLLLGDGAPPAADWGAALADAANKVIAVTRADLVVVAGEVRVVSLHREPPADELERLAAEARQARFRAVWIIVISLVVTVIGICNSMLMSVTERFREIGTMKCLGALSSFIRQLFLIESSVVGLAGSALGCVVGVLFALVAYGLTYGFDVVMVKLAWPALAGFFVLCLVVGLVLSVLAAIYPATIASRMVPAHALRSNI